MRKSYKRVNNQWVEYKASSYELKTGNPKPHRAIMIDGKFFKNIAQAAKELNIAYDTIRYRLINQHKGYSYATFEEVEKHELEKSPHR